jgi:hypothetical protein
MHDGDVELDVAKVDAEWGALRLSGRGRLRLTNEAMRVEAAEGGSLVMPYTEMLGGAWRSGQMVVHGDPGSVTLEASRGLQHAWVSLVSHACPLPELARGHRLLGSRRGGHVDLQAKFLAPFVQARKRLAEEADLDARVATLDARALRDRLSATVQGFAKDAYPASQPDRRALEAELEEALASLFGGISALEQAAGHFRKAPESVRFTAWREWVSSAARVFALADNSWASAARLLPRTLKP